MCAVMKWGAILVDILTLKKWGQNREECRSTFTPRGREEEVSDWLNSVFVEPEWRLGKFAKWGDLVMGLESIRASVQAIGNY